MNKRGSVSDILLTILEGITILAFSALTFYFFSTDLFRDHLWLYIALAGLVVTGLIIGALFGRKNHYLPAFIIQLLPLIAMAAGFLFTQDDITVNRTAIEVESGIAYKIESRGMSLVTSRNDLESIDELKKNHRIGYIDNAAFVEGYQMVKELVDQQGLNCKTLTYSSYGELLEALMEKKVDVAALPADYQNIFSELDGYDEFLRGCHPVFTFRRNITLETQIRNEEEVDSFTVLLSGVDGLKSESLILASFNIPEARVTLSTIPLNTYTVITAYKEGTRDTIDQCSLISRKATVDTVEELYGISVDYFVEMDQSSLVSIEL